MRVMIVGSGGREHALAMAIAKSPLLTALFCAPGNPGTASLGTNLPIAVTDIAGLLAAARAQKIDLVVVGPEAPLVAGLADRLAEAGIACFGPSAAAAALEGSKAFTKQICDAAQIPTAAWAGFTDANAALAYVRAKGAPIVIKADGLAAGKGVVVATSLAEAEAAITAFMQDGTLGDAGNSIVIEECLMGDEVSLFALCDGEDCVLLGAAQDHKRIGDGDTGPNTGGMGAISPPAGFDPAAQAAALDVFIRPALRKMAARGTPFRGFLFAGLMLTNAGPRLIEYNVRLGDPEAQTLIARLSSDLLEALHACVSGHLRKVHFTLADINAVTIVIAAAGYPGTPMAGGSIAGLEAASQPDNVQIFHAGTALRDGKLVASGGRVLAVTATAPTLTAARQAAYKTVSRIDYADGIYRRDIGARAQMRIAEGASQT
jgi:phosphoribosylamine--glycine ligase